MFEGTKKALNIQQIGHTTKLSEEVGSLKNQFDYYLGGFIRCSVKKYMIIKYMPWSMPKRNSR